MKTGRVLSLAGGGSWAIIEARALMQLFPNMTGTAILKQFDVAIGNSGGAIVLAGLAADMTPAEIYALFKDQTKLHQLYTPLGGFDHLFSRFDIGPRYSSIGKFKALQAILGEEANRALSTFSVNIAICAYDLDRARETIFRSYDTKLTTVSGPFVPTLAEAAHASSSAPVLYFDTPAIIKNQKNSDDIRRFWDGGLGSFNVPVRAGLTEAHALGFEQVAILSLGTGLIWRPIGDGAAYAKAGDASLVGAVQCLARDCITAPASAALCDAAICPNTTVVHLSPYLHPDGQPGSWSIPAGLVSTLGEAAWKKLTGFDMDITDPQDIATLSGYAEAWIAGKIPNEPIILDPLTGALQYGQASFDAGRILWQTLTQAAPA
jgi:hypothetical protein